jgi:hypothetical protein
MTLKDSVSDGAISSEYVVVSDTLHILSCFTRRERMEDYRKMKNNQKSGNKIIAVVASVCIICATSTTTYATNRFDLKDMLINKTGFPSVSTEKLISLQGFADSNECKAIDEWNSFRANYDKDLALLKKVGNGPTGLDPKYDLYNVYTQEMADKLDQIVKKYGLALHSSLNTEITTEELIQKVGSGNFLGTANTNEATYLYEDGTFHIDGYANLDSGLKIDYQFNNYKKGTFNAVVLNIGNIEDYDQWSYTTICGTNVHLALSPKKSLIIADLGSSFMTINVLAGTASGFLDEQGKITSSDLEELSNSFNFSLIK